jgi:hypothetical protein
MQQAKVSIDKALLKLLATTLCKINRARILEVGGGRQRKNEWWALNQMNNRISKVVIQ